MIKEELECAFAEIGAHVGELVKCLVQSEISAHMERINQLQAVLNGGACNKSAG